MKDNRISVVLELDDAKKFEEVSKRTRWEDKVIVSIVLGQFYEKFRKDWKKAMTEALEE